MNDPRGSIWRKWDLHIHTPLSYLNNGYKGSFEDFAKTLFSKAIKENMTVIGITDYFTIDGYKQLKLIQNDNKKLQELVGKENIEITKKMLLLPNIEFRLDIIVNNNRVNLHVIFSDQVAIKDIEENFLHEIDVYFEGNPQGPDDTRKLKNQNLIQIGKDLKDEHDDFKSKSDIEIGMMNAFVSDKQISKILVSHPSLFDDKYCIGVPSDDELSKLNWNKQSHLTRKILIQKSDFLFTSSEKTRLWALGQAKGYDSEKFIHEFKSLKPCFHGSDAHDEISLFRPDKDKYCWMKADPTFKGLKQIINEPKKRVYIGKVPDKIDYVNTHKTKFINSIEIRRDNSIKGLKNEKWFDCSIPLNPDLVAIIGNKGSGKSALTDVIGLLGNTQNTEFSFLNDKKFRDMNNKAKYFKGNIEWKDGNSIGKHLDEPDENSEVETVKYIPQNFLEKICTEITESEFLSELESAIFSHIKDEDNIGKHSLKELIDFYSDTITESISNLKKDLNKINHAIIKTEKRLRPENKRILEEQLKQKQLELAALEKPEKVSEPTQLPPDKEKKQKIIIQQLTRIRKIIQFEENDLKQKKEKIKKYKTDLENLQQVKEKIENFRQTYVKLQSDIEELLHNHEIEFEETVNVKINLSKIERRISEYKEQIDARLPLLNESVPNSIPSRLIRCEKIERELQDKLEKPSREYQEYLNKLKRWEQQKEEITGSKDIPDTIEYFSHQIKEIDSLPEQLETEKNKRAEITIEIYRAKKQLAERYSELYTGVQNFISEHKLIQKELNLQFSVSINLDKKFTDSFFEYISQGVTGSFCGTEKGNNAIDSLIKASDFNKENDVIKIVGNITDFINYNYQKNKQKVFYPEKQLRKGKYLIDFYDYIFSLDYLIPKYSLTMNGKRPEQLSPGERGHLLLIFYLLIEQDIKPIILDQPEENLDNQTIYKCLVPCIQEAKKRRQVIVVTHNPNIAVVSDAEQVIYAEHNRKGDMAITYESGAIENPVINKKILDVLEGTRPAFDNRDSKYFE